MKSKLNKTQKAAVESFGNPILIFAGAGSGKTRVLTHKISYLIEKKLVKGENILALTFTNKAAKEMKSRVEKLINKNGALVTMGTFHSICAKILRNEIHHLGYSKDFSIFDVQDQISLLKVILDEMGILKNSISPQEARNQISLYKNKLINPSLSKRKAKSKKKAKKTSKAKSKSLLAQIQAGKELKSAKSRKLKPKPKPERSALQAAGNEAARKFKKSRGEGGTKANGDKCKHNRECESQYCDPATNECEDEPAGQW